MSARHVFTVTVSRHCEEILARELRRMGLQRIVVEPGAVRFTGRLRDGLRACLWSRVGSRVLLRLGRFEAMSADALYAGVATLPWTDHIPPRGTLRVDFVGTSNAIRDERFGAQKVKDAIVDTIRRAAGVRPDVDREHPDITIHVHLRNNIVTVALDLSGAALHLRTPRRHAGAAPLKETLAAALLQLADWPRRAAAGDPLIDPLCGSGTIVLEAAGMAHDVAPGLVRERFGFTRWLGHDPGTWDELVAEAEERRRIGLDRPVAIEGLDIDESALVAARANAHQLGLASVRFSRQSLDDLRPSGTPPGLIVTNPPYGERLDDPAAAIELQRALGDVLRRHMLGWDAFVLVPLGPVSRALGLRPRARHPLFNGPIECRLLEVGIAATAPARLVPGHADTEGPPPTTAPSADDPDKY